MLKKRVTKGMLPHCLVQHRCHWSGQSWSLYLVLGRKSISISISIGTKVRNKCLLSVFLVNTENLRKYEMYKLLLQTEKSDFSFRQVNYISPLLYMHLNS